MKCLFGFLSGVLAHALLRDWIDETMCGGETPPPPPLDLRIRRAETGWKVENSAGGSPAVRDGDTVTWTLEGVQALEGEQSPPTHAVLIVDPEAFQESSLLSPHGIAVLSSTADQDTLTLRARKVHKGKGQTVLNGLLTLGPAGNFVDYDFSYSVLCFEPGDSGDYPGAQGIVEALDSGSVDATVIGEVLAEGTSPPRMIIK